jgi:hypothetical protein
MPGRNDSAGRRTRKDETMRKTNIAIMQCLQELPTSVTRWLIVAALMLNVALALTIAILVAMLVAGVTS